MRSIDYKKTLLVGLFFTTVLTANSASPYESMGATVKAMQKDTRGQNLSNSYEQKLTDNLNALQNSIREAMRVAKSTGRRSAGGGISEGEEILVKVAVVAAESVMLDDLPEKTRKDLLAELNRIEPMLRSKSEMDLQEDVGFSIDKLQDSLGVYDTSFGKSRKRSSARSRRN